MPREDRKQAPLRPFLPSMLLASLALAVPAAAAPGPLPPAAGFGLPLILSGAGALGLAGVQLLRQRRQLRRLQGIREREHLRGRRLAEEVETTHLRCRRLLDYAGDAIFLITPDDGTLLEVNRVAEQLLGYAATEIPRLPLTALFPGQNRRRYLRLVRKVLSEGYGEEGHLVFRRRDGSTFIGAVHARLGDLGSQQVVHGVVRDVTPLVRAERELRRRNRDLVLVNRIAHRAASGRNLQEMLSTVLDEVVTNFEAQGGGIYLVRHEGNDLELLSSRGIDPALVRELARLAPGQGLVGRVAVSGHPRSTPALATDPRLQTEAVRQAGWGGFQAVPLAANDKVAGVLFIFNTQRRLFRREEVRLLLAIGKQVGTAVEGAQLFEALQWQHRLTQASYRELERSRQQLKQNLRQMEESNRTLSRLDQMKSKFLALASHELRTPLTFVLASAQFLEERLAGRIGDAEHRPLEAIRQGGQRLDEIVNDLLEVARLESRSIYLAREQVALPALLAQVHAEFLPRLSHRDLTLTLGEIPDPPRLLGDPFHLRRTFHRLLENATKFTPRGGGIEISGVCRAATDLQAMAPQLRPFAPAFFHSPLQEQFVQVTVRDSGIGIDPEEQVRVFDKFYEVGDIAEHFTSQTRFGGKGVGLGLTLVKGMVEAHGGMVWVESPGTGQPQGGSAFHILLPLSGEAAHGAG